MKIIRGPRTPGAWLYAWAAIAAKYNERERRKVLTNREGRPDKSFRLLRGKLRRAGDGRIEVTDYQMEGLLGMLAKIGCFRMRKQVQEKKTEIKKEGITRELLSQAFQAIDYDIARRKYMEKMVGR